jgi:hypothetical protein
MRLSFFCLSAIGLTGIIQIGQGFVTPMAMAQSIDPDPQEMIFSSTTEQFWTDANILLADKSALLDRATNAVTNPDPIENQTTSTKLLVQLRSLDRFVERYYKNPRQLCLGKAAQSLTTQPLTTRPLGAAAGLDASQVETYCQIYQLSRELTPLRNLLTQRASLFNTSRSANNNVALFFTQPQAAPFNATTVEQVNLATRIAGKNAIEPLVYPRLVGVQRMKLLDNTYRPPAPAIAAPDNILKLIASGQEKILVAQANTPSSIAANIAAARTPAIDSSTAIATFRSGINPTTAPTPARSFGVKSSSLTQPRSNQSSLNQTGIDRFAVPQAEEKLYAEFLKQENTGIARVYPEQMFTVVSNRLDPNIAPTPFGLRIQDGQFVMTGNELDYGFLADMGDVELVQGDRLSVPELFRRYQPPTVLADVQKEQRRFLVGKDTEFSSQLPASLYRTYVMRLVQYELPEIVAAGRPLKPGERGKLRSLLQTSGRDRVIAFRPVTKRLDGSYTILWQILETKPEPTIVDLDRYISLNLKTRGRN